MAGDDIRLQSSCFLTEDMLKEIFDYIPLFSLRKKNAVLDLEQNLC